MRQVMGKEGVAGSADTDTGHHRQLDNGGLQAYNLLCTPESASVDFHILSTLTSE